MYCMNATHGKLYLIFHSYESIVLLWMLIYFLNLNFIWSGVALSISIHVLCDQFTNPLKPFAYFFFYRLKLGLKRQELFIHGYFE